MRESIRVEDRLQLHDARQVAGFEPRDGDVERLLHRRVDPLADEPVEVDAPTEELEVALLEERLVAIGRRPDDLRPARLALDAKPFVQVDGRRQPFVVGENLIGKFVHELIEAQIHFGFDLAGVGRDGVCGVEENE